MEFVHKISLKDEKGTEKIVCDLCRFACNNVAEVKMHLKEVYKKEEWNWMTEEFRLKYSCNDFELDFVTKTLLNEHVMIVHEESGLSVSQSKKVVRFDDETSSEKHNDYVDVNIKEEGEIKIQDLDKPTEYTLKPWGAEENEGYLFEGKKKFSEAHSKLKICPK